MQKKDRYQRRPGCRRAEDIAGVTQSFPYFKIMQTFGGTATLHKQLGAHIGELPYRARCTPLWRNRRVERESSIIQSKMTDEQLFVGARTMAGNSPPRCPPNKLSESRVINHWSDQPEADQLVNSAARICDDWSTRSTDYSSRLLRTRWEQKYISCLSLIVSKINFSLRCSSEISLLFNKSNEQKNQVLLTINERPYKPHAERNKLCALSYFWNNLRHFSANWLHAVTLDITLWSWYQISWFFPSLSGIDLANSIFGSGWFYSGYSGFHPFFQKIRKEHTKEKTKRDKKKRFEKTKSKQNAKVTENKFLSRFLIKKLQSRVF